LKKIGATATVTRNERGQVIAVEDIEQSSQQQSEESGAMTKQRKPIAFLEPIAALHNLRINNQRLPKFVAGQKFSLFPGDRFSLLNNQYVYQVEVIVNKAAAAAKVSLGGDEDDSNNIALNNDYDEDEDENGGDGDVEEIVFANTPNQFVPHLPRGNNNDDSQASSSSAAAGQREEEFTCAQEFTCFICLGLLFKPRIAIPCTHSFCTLCIENHLAKNSEDCPVCDTKIESTLRYRTGASVVDHLINFSGTVDPELLGDIAEWKKKKADFSEEKRERPLPPQGEVIEVGESKKRRKVPASISPPNSSDVVDLT
jgi:hypothetical protein